MGVLGRVRRALTYGVLSLVAVASIAGSGAVLSPQPTYAAGCSDTSFFVLPNWYRGLGVTKNNKCLVDITHKDGTWQTGVLTIGLNLLDGLLRLAGLIAVIFVIIGGVRYIISQGAPAGIQAAKGTIVRAIVGLAIAISASLILNFIAGNIFGLTVNPTSNQVNGTGAGARGFNGGSGN